MFQSTIEDQRRVKRLLGVEMPFSFPVSEAEAEKNSRLVAERLRLLRCKDRTKKNRIRCKSHKISLLKLWEECKGACFYCGRRVPFNKFSRDHKTPLSLGGTPHKENVVGCCKTCNNAKGDQPFEEFMNSSWLKRVRNWVAKEHYSFTWTWGNFL